MRNKTEEFGRKVLMAAAVVFVIILLVATVLFVIQKWENKTSNAPAHESVQNGTLVQDGREYVLKKNIETFLVLGLDKFENDNTSSYNNDKQADFLLLFVLDNDKKTYTAIEVNRDTLAKMNVLGVAGDKIGEVTKQIALSHTYGNGKEVSCRNTANALSDLLLGVDVDHYVSFTMDAVPVINDFVGGVEVEVLDDLTSVDASLVKGEKVTLMGDTALTYVRARYGLDDPTNINRMKRQRQYIEALFEKTLALYDEGFSFTELVVKLSDTLVSDRSTASLEKYVEKIREYEFQGIKEIEGESVEGVKNMEFYPDEKALSKLVIDVFYKEK